MVQAPSSQLQVAPTVEGVAEAAICRGTQRAVEAGGRRVGVVTALALAVERQRGVAGAQRGARRNDQREVA